MNVVAALLEPAGVGLAAALQPANLVVLAAGVLFGALASWLTGWARPVVWLALLAPFAQVLEPLAGVAMLVGVLSGAAACSGPFDARHLVWTFGLTLAVGMVMALIAPWLGPLFRGFKSVDRVWLSAAANCIV